ncbi:MAG: heavy-metal-associated domain-containing protein [Oscillospiraceae bacterium]|nr:heavy-metal-associated domain-containing protein [Candidatus Equicaccousia limihippi]
MINETISIKDMMCEHCAAAVKSALEGAGATNVKIDLAAKTASYDRPDSLTSADLINAVKEIGFDAK